MNLMKAMCTIVAVALQFSPATFASVRITGSVRNQTSGQPAVGDEVILVRLDHGSVEEMHTATDARGEFSLEMQYPEKHYLVRVVHESVSYDERVPASGRVAMLVFDVSPHVSGIVGTIEILRADLNGKSLHVADMYEITNNSNPAVTQAGDRTFEVYLPAHANLDSVLAAGPEKIGAPISATPLPGEPGHYSVAFPLRPGSTKFVFDYDLPYSGHVVFHTRHSYQLQQLAVVFPPQVKFSSSSSAFALLATGNSRYQAWAANYLKEGDGPSFEISGAAESPPSKQEAMPTSSAPVVGTNSEVSGSNRTLKTSVSTATQGLSYLVAAVVTCLFLAVCIFLMRRVHRASGMEDRVSTGRDRGKSQGLTSAFESLKGQLFQLETQRLSGSISADEYKLARESLESSLRQALKS